MALFRDNQWRVLVTATILLVTVVSCLWLHSLAVASEKEWRHHHDISMEDSSRLEAVFPNEIHVASPLHDSHARHNASASTNGFVYGETLARQAIQPIWSCNDSYQSRKGNKLAFVHVFKTAGSSVREFLRDYSATCGTSYGSIVSCSHVNPKTMLAAKQSWKPCILKDFQTRHGFYFDLERNGVINNTFLDTQLDVMAGHFSIGNTDHLLKRGLTQHVRHVVFFRHAVSKYISAKVYTAPRRMPVITMEHLIVDVCNSVYDKFRTQGEYYTKYYHYLLTPIQKQQYKLGQVLKNPTKMLEMTNTMMQNMLDYNVIAGIVERMPESLELLNHVLGTNKKNEKRRKLQQQSQSASQKTRGRRAITNKVPLHYYNPSVIPASGVLQVIQQYHSECYLDLVEYVKYEQMVTDFALEMHTKQHNALLKARNGQNVRQAKPKHQMYSRF